MLYICVLPQRLQTLFEKTELLSVFSLTGPSATNNYCSFESLPCVHALLTQNKEIKAVLLLGLKRPGGGL